MRERRAIGMRGGAAGKERKGQGRAGGRVLHHGFPSIRPRCGNALILPRTTRGWECRMAWPRKAGVAPWAMFHRGDA
jgi:hypothetical protein